MDGTLDHAGDGGSSGSGIGVAGGWTDNSLFGLAAFAAFDMVSRSLVWLVLAAVAVWAAVAVLPDGRLHVVFCDVGQGDAILVSLGTNQLLVDGGPNNKVLSCLGRHMPFYDKRIEVVILTHPDADHSGGLAYVLERYGMLSFVTVPVDKESSAFRKLVMALEKRKTRVRNLYMGDKVRMGGAELEAIWPERSRVLGASTTQEANQFSIGGIIKFGEFEVLLTGDADGKIMEEQARLGKLMRVEVAKVPHHGSKKAAISAWWEAVKPQVAVISVGRNNYGHPSEEVIKMLRELDLPAGRRVRMLRTDVDGEVEIVSDGKSYSIL